MQDSITTYQLVFVDENSSNIKISNQKYKVGSDLNVFLILNVNFDEQLLLNQDWIVKKFAFAK